MTSINDFLYNFNPRKKLLSLQKKYLQMVKLTDTDEFSVTKLTIIDDHSFTQMTFLYTSYNSPASNRLLVQAETHYPS